MKMPERPVAWLAVFACWAGIYAGWVTGEDWLGRGARLGLLLVVLLLAIALERRTKR